MVSAFKQPLTAQAIKAKARALGADLVGIADGANLERYPPDPNHPRRPSNITELDGGRVIVLAKRVSRGAARIAAWNDRHKYYNDELTLSRLEEASRCRRGGRAHVSFPLGIHPVGQMLARAAAARGIAVNWAGSGTTTPSPLQLELIERLQPTIWMGMSSYGLHLANLAEARGLDLGSRSVETVLCSAEPLSDAKRDKLARHWGAQVRDTFGMTEAGMMGAEDAAGWGFRIWTDLFFIEVLDPETHAPVAEDAVGTLVVTPLWTSNVTPFLRWSSGDLVTWRRGDDDSGPFSVFPLLKHDHRTSGFFKIRGININHADFEDFIFRNVDIGDFKAATERDLDTMLVSVEVRHGLESAATAERLKMAIRDKFGLTSRVAVIETGTLAREFEASVKMPRFSDHRG